MMTNKFEIRVAVIGYVSVGKTTLINALFGEEYGEVSMRRTTAVVNAFRVSSKVSTAEEDPELVTLTEESASEGSIEIVSQKLSASVTLQETTKDNKTFRNSDVVKERTFDIALEEPLHKMRHDTKLVVVDVPGINEAGTSSKYKDYVNSNWYTFDIVVVVMDARQGVNTDEQHDLLNLVKENLSSSKKIPVIVVGNKVDDSDNKEQQALLDEARAAVSKLFRVGDRKEALRTILSGSPPQNKTAKMSLFPAVVPVSAMHAFVYRCGSRLSFDEFKKMDDDFIEKIGKDYYGRQWNRFGRKKKQEKAYRAVSEKEFREDGVEASNFEAFVKVLSYCIGDVANQTMIIEKQAEVALERLKRAPPDCDLGMELLTAQRKLTALGKPIGHLPGVFWAAFKKLRDEAYNDLKSKLSPKAFGAPMKQLHTYLHVLSLLQWPNEVEEVSKNAKEVALQYAILLTGSEDFQKMSGSDQALILGSMLLYSSDHYFTVNFGFLKIYLETKRLALGDLSIHEGQCYSKMCEGDLEDYREGTERCTSCVKIWIKREIEHCPICLRRNLQYALSHQRHRNGVETARCPSGCTFHIAKATAGFCTLKFQVENGKLVPADEESYKKIVTVVVPDSLENPAHYGHVFWKCCQILKDADT